MCKADKSEEGFHRSVRTERVSFQKKAGHEEKTTNLGGILQVDEIKKG